MSLKGNIKSIVDTIKYQDATQIQTQQSGRAMSVLTLALSAVAAIMSYMNYIQHHLEMMIVTVVLTVVLLCVFIFSLTTKIRKLIDIMLCILLSLLCLYFALSGGNDGFAILWTLLLPTITMLIIGFMYGVSIGIFFEVFFIILFWTPAKNMVSTYYSQTFMLRFPMLYTAFFILSFIAKYLITKQEITEHYYIQTIERLSMIDQLTNIPNRRYFDDRLRQEWNRAIRNNDPISILLIDVDKFKNYNDTYGHLQGDTGLQSIANVFVQTFKRSEDFVARWGGEEFTVLLSNTESDQAFAIAEKIRKQVADTQIPFVDGQMTNLTISIGVNSQTPSLNSSLDDFIRCADDALYIAKNEGRNRVYLYTE